MTQDEKNAITGELILTYQKCQKTCACLHDKCRKIATALQLLSLEFQQGLENLDVTDTGIRLKYDDDGGTVQDFVYDQKSLRETLIEWKSAMLQKEALEQSLRNHKLEDLIKS